MNQHEKRNYVEFSSTDLASTKLFFSSVFGWEFIDCGPEYVAFSNQGFDGGFYKSDIRIKSNMGCALLVFYSANIESTLNKVNQAGGVISRSVFEFPGGCHFHFIEPGGNEFAVWSESCA